MSDTDKKETFVCANCGKTVEKEWTDEEAAEEFAEQFPDEDFEQSVLVCEGCYEELYNKLWMGGTKDER